MATKIKVPMTKKRKLTVLDIALVVIVVIPLATYGLLFYYVTSTNSFHLGFMSLPRSQFKTGQQYQVIVVINYKYGSKYGIRDQFTLTVSSRDATWTSFAPFPYKNGTQTLTQFTVIPPKDAATLVIKIPDSAQTGNYSITVLATNNIGLKSSFPFNFTVT